LNEDEPGKPAYSEFINMKSGKKAWPGRSPIRIDFPPPLAGDGERGRGSCRLVISRQSAAKADVTLFRCDDRLVHPIYDLKRDM
jgi:hypothetical protein